MAYDPMMIPRPIAAPIMMDFPRFERSSFPAPVTVRKAPYRNTAMMMGLATLTNVPTTFSQTMERSTFELPNILMVTYPCAEASVGPAKESIEKRRAARSQACGPFTAAARGKEECVI